MREPHEHPYSRFFVLLEHPCQNRNNIHLNLLITNPSMQNVLLEHPFQNHNKNAHFRVFRLPKHPCPKYFFGGLTCSLSRLASPSWYIRQFLETPTGGSLCRLGNVECQSHKMTSWLCSGKKNRRLRLLKL